MIKFKFGAMVALAMVIAISCENELQGPVEEGVINIQEAKNWFQKNYGVSKNLTPRWDKAIAFSNSVEMPYEVNKKVGLPNTSSSFENLGRQRIVITQHESSFSLTTIQYIPSENFKGDVKRIHSRNFKSEKFDGIITLQEFGQDQLKILHIDQGLITTISKSEKKVNESSQKVNCASYELCTLWFIFVNGEYSYSDYTCNSYCAYEEITYPDGSYDAPEDGESPFPWDGDGGGNGGDTSTNDPYWHTCIQNQLINPCLSSVADHVLNPSLVSTYNSLIQDIFNSNDRVNLTLVQGPLENAIGNTVYPSGNENSENDNIDIVITLDATDFAGASQEYIGSAIYHECFHAIVDYLTNNGVPEDNQHISQFTSYLNLLGDGLQAAYPNMLPGDAKGLILQGLINLDGGTNPPPGYWTTSFVDKILNSNGFSRSQVGLIFHRYQVFHTSGTPC